MNSLDILRYLVVANSILLTVQSVRVVLLYVSVYSLTPNDWKRQLPLHVWVTALSFAIYVGATTYFLHTASGNDLSRVLLYGAAGLLGQFGLWNVLQYDRRRYSLKTGFQDPGETSPSTSTKRP